MALKQLFRLGNKRRWRAPYKPMLWWRVVRLLWRVPLRLHRRLRDHHRARRDARERRRRAELRGKLAQPGQRFRIKLDEQGRRVLPSDERRKSSTRPRSTSREPTATTPSTDGAPTTVSIAGATKDAPRPRARKWIEIPRRLRQFRFAVAWSIGIGLYVAAAFTAMIYGVLYDEPAFAEMLIAWLLGLGFTWLVVEPSEVLGLVLFPNLANNDRVAYCRNKCKELGIYG